MSLFLDVRSESVGRGRTTNSAAAALAEVEAWGALASLLLQAAELAVGAGNQQDDDAEGPPPPPPSPAHPWGPSL